MKDIQKVDGIYRTECISFPRSGHHALKDVMAEYFGEDFHYCDSYLAPELRLRLNEQTNYQKNHDLELTVPVHDDRRYIIQVRNPIVAIQSWIDLDVRTGERAEMESPTEWHKETALRLRYWEAFMEKWFCQRIYPRLVVQYEQLIARPFPVCVSVVQFLTGIQAVNMPKLEDALKKFPIVVRSEKNSIWYSQA